MQQLQEAVRELHVSCDQKACLYNRADVCGAGMISVAPMGKGRTHPLCAAYAERDQAQKPNAPACCARDTTVSCSVHDCRYLRLGVCRAEGLRIRKRQGDMQPSCTTCTG